MSLRVLNYIASKGSVTREQIVDAREVWDPQYGIHKLGKVSFEHHQHVDDLLVELQDQGLIKYNSSKKEVSLTEKGEKVSKILLKKK
jgi:predicted transcriptional regulator